MAATGRACAALEAAPSQPVERRATVRAFRALAEQIPTAYQVRGYRPSFRLAARQDGRLVIFEADTNPGARVGRDLLDLDGKVRRISINSQSDGTTELGAISDPKQVAGMVRMLLAGPVDQRVEPAGEQTVWLLAFHLRDGTATVRAYDPAKRRVQRGILVPRRFGDLVQAAAA